MTDRKEFRELVDPETAEAAVAALPIDPGTEERPLEAARGAVLAERIDAAIDVPGFDRATLDGYAVSAQDTFGANEADPVTLSIVGTVEAGEQPPGTLATGEAIEIATGAVLPPGADAMVPIERIREAETTIEVETAVAPGDNVAFAGSDIAAGDRALGPGRRLTSREIALLAALGHETVTVQTPPTVGIISTGRELVQPGNPLQHDHGEIYDVNSRSIAAAVAEVGGEPTVFTPVGDDRAAIADVIDRATETCDLVVSSGSTSASAADQIYRVIADRGEVHVHGVKLKPGKPTIVGTINDTGYVGLPGYPVSALMVFRTLVAPTLRTAVGRSTRATPQRTATMAREERFTEGRRRLLPVGVVTSGDGELLAYPVDRGSGATTSVAAADGLVTVPADVSYLADGETVTVEFFAESIQPPSVLVIGESDPAVGRALDALDRPRYRQTGTRVGLRQLRAGIPDVVVVTGPLDPAGETIELASFQREWGLVVPTDNPDEVEGLASLVDRELTFVNRSADAGIRAALDDQLAALAEERDTDRRTLEAAINGWGQTTRGLESPARAVLRGTADVGIGIAATAHTLDIEVLPLGSISVRVLAASDRYDKAGVQALEMALETAIE